jgi:putative salt-induced outer membrane protein
MVRSSRETTQGITGISRFTQIAFLRVSDSSQSSLPNRLARQLHLWHNIKMHIAHLPALIAAFGVIASVVRVEAQTAPPPPPPGWTGSASAGLALTSGNSDSSNVNVAYDVKRDTGGPFLFKSTALFLYGETEEVTTSDRLSLDGRVERKLSDRTSLFAQTQYLRDEFKAIDYLVSPTFGLNRIVAKNDRTELSADAGVGVVWEKNPDLELQTDGAVSAGQKFTHKLTATTELTQKVNALWKMDDFNDALYVFGLGLAANITGGTQMKIEFLDTYKARPPVDIEKNDIATLVSFVYKFE